MEAYSDKHVWKNFRVKLHNLRKEQIERIEKESHARRFLYNWALNYCNEYYQETGKTPPYQELARKFTILKKSDPNFIWLDDKLFNVTTCRYAFIDLCAAYHNFLTGVCRHPKFMKRKDDSIRIACDSKAFTIKGETAYVPGVSMKRGDYIYIGKTNIPTGPDVKYSNIRVKFDGVDYWLSLSVKLKRPMNFDSSKFINEGIGIDVGIRTSAALSNGKMYDKVPQNRLDRLDKRRRKIQSLVDKDIARRIHISNSTKTKYYDIPKSKNQLKREKKLAKTKIKIYNIYKNYYHNISREIVNEDPQFIVLEDLNIPSFFKGAYGKRRFDTYESRLGTLSEYIAYKAIEADIPVIYADRDYPSSQICSGCGYRQNIGPKKIYQCPFCGLTIDRDLNAAINLRNFGISTLSGNINN